MRNLESLPIRQTPMPARCLFGDEEKQAVINLFDQAMCEGSSVMGYNGEQKKAYCEEWSAFLDGGYVETVNSGTTAIYVALAALELEPGSEVIVPAVTDPGGCMPVTILNLIPVPADTEEDYFCVNAETIAAKITKKTKAIIVAHIGGRSADMESIMKLAQQHNIPVIEDCAQNHGGRINGQRAGTFGHISTFSLMFQKQHASGGQGGIVYTKDQELYWKIRQFADRGKPYGIENQRGRVCPSLNFNMDELHACIGRVQLRKLPDLINQTQQLASTLARLCKERLRYVEVVTEPTWGDNTYWLLFLRVDLSAFRIGINQIIKEMDCQGISGCWLYDNVPMRMPWAVELYGPCVELPNCTKVIGSQISLGMNEQFTLQDLEDVVNVLVQIEREYGR